jgi:hypothetical protein
VVERLFSIFEMASKERRNNMGIARGIFVIDTHVHAVRVAMKFKERGVKPSYEGVFGGMTGKVQAVTYDNSERLLYHMDRYGVDMAVIMALGGDNETLVKILEKHPDRFIGRTMPSAIGRKARDGEAEWTIEAACKEMDELLSTGLFRGGIGEGMPGSPVPRENLTWRERYEEICQVVEVARKHNPVMQVLQGPLQATQDLRIRFWFMKSQPHSRMYLSS